MDRLKRLAVLKWSKTHPRNAILFVTSAGSLSIGIVALIIGSRALETTLNDFESNAVYDFGPQTSPPASAPAAERYKPCGLSTPDPRALLRATAQWSDGGFLPWDGTNATTTLLNALCKHDVFGWTAHTDCASPPPSSPSPGEYKELTRELLAVSDLFDIPKIKPNSSDEDAEIGLKVGAFEAEMCKLSDSSKYPKNEHKAFGDVKRRVTRAYYASMPAFLRYDIEVTDHGPFAHCPHRCHIKKELERAAEEWEQLLTPAPSPPPPPAPSTPSTSPTFLQQLYRLIALSVVAQHNHAIFSNSEIAGTAGALASALEMCATVYTTASAASSPPSPPLDATDRPIDRYHTRTSGLWTTSGCSASTDTIPALPEWARVDSHMVAEAEAAMGSVGGDDALAVHVAVCADSLRYGLYDTQRLFGLPDPIGHLAQRNTPIAKQLYDQLFGKGAKDERFRHPVARLELYSAYRLAATAVWCTLVAVCAGFFIARGAVPVVLIALKMCNLAKTADGDNPTLVRPLSLNAPEVLAISVTAFTCLWVLFVDPAVHYGSTHAPAYYVTPSCADWGARSSGPFVASRDATSNPNAAAHWVASLLIAVLALLFLHRAVFRWCVAAVRLRNAPGGVRGAARAGVWQRIQKLKSSGAQSAFWVLLLSAALVVLLFAIQAVFTGEEFLKEATALAGGGRTAAIADTLGKDVHLTAVAGVWIGAAIGVVRQKWAVQRLGSGWLALWGGSALVLLWLPVAWKNAVFDDELNAPSPSDVDALPGADARHEVWVVTLVLTLVASGAVVAIVMSVSKGQVRVAGADLTQGDVAREKVNIRKWAEGSGGGGGGGGGMGGAALGVLERVANTFAMGASAEAESRRAQVQFVPLLPLKY